MDAVAEALPGFLGAIVKPTDPDYETVRRVHNGLIDKRPSLIARCRGVADIVDAVGYGRDRGVEISVRGGGHNVGGRAVTEGGLMVDLSLMKSVHVDAANRIAIVEGGALWKDVNRETQLHGLAVTGGVVGTTGVAGLTLGGGLGWLMSKFGLALDNLRAVNLVLADGSVVRTSEGNDPDLFWAVRGGGGNFGVAASFEFNLHALGPMIRGGLAAFPPPEVRQVLRAWREMMATAPDDFSSVAAMLSAPDGSGAKVAGVAACHCGPTKEAEETIKRIKSFGTVAMDAMGPIPYTALNGMLDANYPRGAHNYWKSIFLPELSDAAIDLLADAHTVCPSEMGQIVLEHFHGAVTRVPLEATAFSLRSAGFNAVVLGQWMEPAKEDATTAWVRDAAAKLQPFAGPRRYVNYVTAEDEASTGAVAAYGPNLARLRRLKKQYDPDNLFHLNVNILPA